MQLVNKFKKLWDKLFPFKIIEDLYTVKAQMFILHIRQSIVDKIIKYGKKLKTFQEVIASTSYYKQNKKDKAIKTKLLLNTGTL